MEHLREWMYSCVRFKNEPRNAAYAAVDLFISMDKHLDEAVKDFEETEETQRENERLREENAQLRRLLGLKEDAA